MTGNGERPEVVGATDEDSLTLGEARTRLYEVLDETDRPVVEQYRRALSLGCAYLGVENGHLKSIPGPDGAGARVSVAAGDIGWIAGDTMLDSAGFCRMTVQQEDSLAIADAPAEGYGDDPGYAEYGAACYLGAPVTVEGETYGTVCFVSTEPRETRFDEQERLFVELLAQMLGRRLEREHHAAALSESRSKYASLIDASPDPVFLVDFDSLAIVEVNEAAEELTGYDAESLVETSYTALWNGDGDAASAVDREADPAEALEWFTSGDARRTHPDGSAITVVRRDGTTVPVEVSANRVTVADRDLLHAVVRDIRDERRRERRAQAIFDQTHQFTGLLSPDGTLLEANDTAMAAIDADREAIVGDPFPTCPWWQTDAATRDRLRRAIDRAADGEFVRYEVELATVDGPLMVDFSIRPVTDDDGEVELLIPEGRDISERHERDRQLAVLARVLRHNLRNDITVIRGYAKHIADHADGNLVDSAETVAETASGLAAQVDAYRQTVALLSDPPDPEPIALADCLASAVADCRNSFPAATVDISVPDDLRVSAVPTIDQAFAELLENALVHAEEEAPSVAVTAARDGDRVTVTVADDGPGIPDQEARVLTGDQSITPLDHGTGVGLWRTHWICALSGAEPSVSVDDGTTVTLSFRVPE